MTDRPHKKNHTPPGTPPNKPRCPKPGRGRPANGYDLLRREWKGGYTGDWREDVQFASDPDELKP